MVCYFPRNAWFKEDGSFTFNRKQAVNPLAPPMKSSCKQCFGCRRKNACDWATRCVHEQSLHDCSSFITLTYDQQNIPSDRSLCHRDWQLFMKSFREDNPHVRIRQLMCGEYGEDLGRPHFHGIIFGHDFYADRTPFKRGPGGHMIYNSSSLDRYWKRGWATVSDVCFESAAYVAGYCFKKINGDKALTHYERYDPYTGEVFLLRPEYNRASKFPPLGIAWLEKFHEEIFVNDDHVVLSGDRHVGIPRAYRDWYKLNYPSAYEAFKARSLKSYDDRLKADLKLWQSVNGASGYVQYLVDNVDVISENSNMRRLVSSDLDVFATEYNLLVEGIETDYVWSRREAAVVSHRANARKESL